MGDGLEGRIKHLRILIKSKENLILQISHCILADPLLDTHVVSKDFLPFCWLYLLLIILFACVEAFNFTKSNLSIVGITFPRD